MSARTLLLLLLIATPLHAQKISRATADWIRVHTGELRNQTHSVQVSAVKPGRIEGQAQWFTVWTSDNDGRSSSIAALVPVQDAPSFLEKYGTSARWTYNKGTQNKRLDAIVRVDNRGTVYLEVGDHSNHLPADDLAAFDGTKIRTWTDTQGRTITAEFLRHNTTHVTVRRTLDGQVFYIRLDLLSPEDRDWVSSQ